MELYNAVKPAEAGVPVISDTTVQVINDYKQLSKTMSDFQKMLAPVQQPQNAGLLGILDEEIVGQIKQGLRERINVSNLFAPAQQPQSSSLLKDGLRTIQSLAEHPESPISRLIGDTLNNIAEAYNGYKNKNGNNGNTNELHKNEEDIYKEVLAMSPDNIEHLARYTQIIRQNPENPATSSIEEIRKLLVNDQAYIRKKFGIPTEEQQPQQDINRELIQKYENQPGQTTTGSGNFFNNNPPQGSQSPDEVILSLSPDDPVSIHTYASMRNLNNLDATTIRKTLIKEQEQLRKAMQPGIDSKWTEHDAQRTLVNTPQNDGVEHMSKAEFLADIAKESGLPVQVQQTQEQLSEQSPSPSNPENPFETIMRILEKQDKNIDYITNEIVYLKSRLAIEEPAEVITDDSDNLVSETNKTIPSDNITKDEIPTENVIEDIKPDVINKEDSSDLNEKEQKEENPSLPPALDAPVATLNSSVATDASDDNTDEEHNTEVIAEEVVAEKKTPKHKFVIKKKRNEEIMKCEVK